MAGVSSNNILMLLRDLSTSSDKIVDENGSELGLHRVSEWASFIEKKADSILESDSSIDLRELPSLTFFLKGKIHKGKRLSQVLGIQKSHIHGREKVRGSSISHKTRKSQRSSIKTPLRKSSLKSKGETFIVDSEGDANIETDSSRQPKRKSSSKLSAEIVKKPKINYDVSVPRERDKALHSQNGKVEKLMKAKDSTHLLSYSTIKSAGTASVLKENKTLRTRMEKALENRENILALRKQKLEESKRTKEERLEKTLQQRMKLENEKMSQLEKGTKKVGTKKKPTTKEVIIKEKDTIFATSKYSEKGVEPMVKKMQNAKVGPPTSTLKSNLTPVMKSSRLEKIMNTEKPTKYSGKNGKTNDTNLHNGSVSGNKTLPAQKSAKKTLNEKNKQQVSTPLQKKQGSGSESYTITPAHSSFVSYDISEIRSDSEDEEQPPSNKPIPSWATGVRLRNTLLQQHHHPINTDELFGNFFDPPDLVTIMGIKKARKRTSSAVWNSSFV